VYKHVETILTLYFFSLNHCIIALWDTNPNRIGHGVLSFTLSLGSSTLSQESKLTATHSFTKKQGKQKKKKKTAGRPSPQASDGPGSNAQI
jgi:hypothetical protein